MKKQRFSKTFLLERVEIAARHSANDSWDLRARSFIACLCGAIEVDCPDVAKALAVGAGMGHLYEKKEGD